MKKGRFQWRTSVLVRAPRERVWAIVDDIALIPEYHPDVRQVDLLNGQRTRALGVRYRCTVPEGRAGSCVEEVVESVDLSLNSELSVLAAMSDAAWRRGRVHSFGKKMAG